MSLLTASSRTLTSMEPVRVKNTHTYPTKLRKASAYSMGKGNLMLMGFMVYSGNLLAYDSDIILKQKEVGARQKKKTKVGKLTIGNVSASYDFTEKA